MAVSDTRSRNQFQGRAGGNPFAGDVYLVTDRDDDGRMHNDLPAAIGTYPQVLDINAADARATEALDGLLTRVESGRT